MEKYVKCSSCGAQFSAEKIRCPYCGTAYEPAAEEEYMGQLEDVRTELDQHKTDADKSTMKSLLRAIFIFIAVVVVILLVGIGANILPEMGRHARQREKKEQFMQKYSESVQEQEKTE